MNRPPTEIETRQLEELMHAVDDLRRRVAALECQSLPAPAIAPSPREFDGPPADLSTGVLGALGRLLLGIAGAYLLRAITEAALLPQLAGTLAGLLCQRVASVRGQYSYRESSDRHLPRPHRRAHRSSIALGSHCSIQFALTRRRRRRDRVVYRSWTGARLAPGSVRYSGSRVCRGGSYRHGLDRRHTQSGTVRDCFVDRCGGD